MRADLKRLKRETESGRSSIASSDDDAPLARSGAMQSQPSLRAAQSSTVASTQAASASSGFSAPSGTVAPVKSRKKIFAVAAIAAFAAAFAGGIFISHSRANKLTEKDSIVLADFTNTTGDAVFDGTLKTALQGSLAQTEYAKLQ